MTTAAPRPIRIAIGCLVVSAILVGVLTALQLGGLVQSPGTGFTLFVGGFTVALLALVATQIAARRNWARWLFVVIYLLGSGAFLLSLLVLPQAFRTQPLLLRTSAVAQTILQTVALFAMFTGDSRRWFASSRKDASQSAL